MNELLDRWGSIAAYMRISEKTAIRYSKRKTRPLPIKYDPAGHPIITKSAVDRWKQAS